jgi:hypothetical protein
LYQKSIRLLGFAVQGNLAVVTTKFTQLQPVGGVLGVLAGGVVAIVTLGALKRKKWAISLWHYLKSLLSRLSSWSRRQELNPQPTVYKTVALPLSYVGTVAS